MFLILMIGTVLSLIVGVAPELSPGPRSSPSWHRRHRHVRHHRHLHHCGLHRRAGEGVRRIQWLIDFIGRRVKTAKGAQIGIAGLVAAVDVATANNTVAIVMTGSIAKDISEEYNIDPRAPPPCWTSSPR